MRTWVWQRMRYVVIVCSYSFGCVQPYLNMDIFYPWLCKSGKLLIAMWVPCPTSLCILSHMSVSTEFWFFYSGMVILLRTCIADNNMHVLRFSMCILSHISFFCVNKSFHFSDYCLNLEPLPCYCSHAFLKTSWSQGAQ